jgi:hypothetical protein
MGESPHLYEMGLPVVELVDGDPWHVNVQQKLPLNRDRDNVRPSYLRTLRVAVLNSAHHLFQDDEEAKAAWVRVAGGDPRCTEETTKHLILMKFGNKTAAPDPSDVEAMKNFVASGGTIVSGLSKEEWANVRKAGIVKPAGQIMPTTRVYKVEGGENPNIVPQSKWTPAVANIAKYAQFLAYELMGVDIDVIVVNTTDGFLACYGDRELGFNLMRLGHAWFDDGPNVDVDEILIHELAHEKSHDHLSDEYHDALCNLGAKLKELALNKPEVFRVFMKQ